MDGLGLNLANFIIEECSFVPDDVRKQLEESLLKMIESLKCDYEQKISSLEKSVLQLQEEENSDRLIEADLKLENLTEEVQTLQATCERLENEKQVLQKQTEDAVGKYESLGNMLRNYDMQINHWKEKCAILNADYEKLNCDYCDVVDKYMSIKGLEVDYNRRLAETQTEWENSSKEIRRLQAEIDNLTTELAIAKDESKTEQEALKSQLAVKSSEINIRQQCIQDLKEKIEKGDKVIEKLSLRLKEEREVQIRQVEALEREIQELKNLAQLYKQTILDEESKLGDVAEGHKELLELIKYGEKKCKTLESELWKTDYNCKKHEENVKKLEIEVDRLNNELAKCRSENVTRSIDELFPMIGAGRQLLKSDISFTEMLRRYSKTSDEIFSLKEENMSLKNAIERIAKEFEAKAPYLKQQKKEYSKALQTIDEQVRQIDDIKAALEQAAKEKSQSENERRMCESVVMDLSKQIQHLTMQLNSTRRGMFMNKNMDDGEYDDQAEIVFSSVEELQAKNVKLLKKIKFMSEKEMERQVEIANLQQINERSLLTHREKYHQLELAIDEYKDTNNNLRQQLKVYQNLYKKKLDKQFGDIPFFIPESTIAVQTDLTFHDVENLLRDKTRAELFAKDLQEKADLIGKERQESQKQLEKLRSDMCEIRSINSMLRAELDHAKETFISLNDTKDTFKKQVTLLENQCKEYYTNFMKHEKEIEALKAAVKVEHDACLRQTDSLHHSQREYMALFEKEKRLRSEYEQLKQCESVLSVINASIELLKVNAEKKNTESHEQLGTDMSSAMEECSVLRHLLQDKYKELDKLHSEKDTALKMQLELEEKFSKDLEVAKKEIESRVVEITSLKNSLNEHVLQKAVFSEQREKLKEELAARNLDLKDHVVQCEEYRVQLDNLTAELEKYKADALRNDAKEELLKEINDLKEKLLTLEKEKVAESISHEIVEKENKSQEEKFESILELEKQMNVDKELSMHSKAMVELMKDATLKSDEIVKLKAEIEKAYADLADMDRDFKHKEKEWESECTQLQQHISSLEAKNSLLCDQLKILDSQQLASNEKQMEETGSVVITEPVTVATYESESVQPFESSEYPEQKDVQQITQTHEVFSNEGTAKMESGEVHWVCRDSEECAVMDAHHYSTGMGEMGHNVSLIASAQNENVALQQEAEKNTVHNIDECHEHEVFEQDKHQQQQGIRTTIGRRRTSRRKSNYGKRRGVDAVLEPRILLTFKKNAVSTSDAEETFQVNMPGSLVVLDENQHYSTISHTAPEQERDDGGSISLVDQHRTMDFHGERQLEESYDAEQEEGGDSQNSEEARDFTVLQPMPPTFDYISELAPPDEIDVTLERTLPQQRASPQPPPVPQTKHVKDKRRGTSSRPPRGTGTARRSRGTFKTQRKRSSSVDEQPSSSTKISRRK